MTVLNEANEHVSNPSFFTTGSVGSKPQFQFQKEKICVLNKQLKALKSRRLVCERR